MKILWRYRSVGLFALLLAACGRYEVGSTDRDPVPVSPPVVVAPPEKPSPGVEPETNLPCGGPWGVCWEYPKLSAENVVGVTAAPGSKEAWAITEGGSILKFDGTDWSTAVTQRFSMLGMAIAAPAGNDIRAVGAITTEYSIRQNAVQSSGLYEMRFSGATWRQTTSSGTVPYALFKANDGEESLPPPTFQKPNGTFEELSFVAFERSATGVVAMASDGRVFRASNRTWVEERLGLPESNGDASRFVACGLYRHRDGSIDAVVEEDRNRDESPQAQTVISIHSLGQLGWVKTATWESPFRPPVRGVRQFDHRGHSVAFFDGSLYVASRVTNDLVRFSKGKGELVDSQARLTGLAVAGDSLVGVGPEGRVVELDGPRGRIVHNAGTSKTRVTQLMATSSDSVIGLLSLNTHEPDERRSRLFRYSDGKRTTIPGPTWSYETSGPNGPVIAEAPYAVLGFSALSETDIWVTTSSVINPISHWDGSLWSDSVAPETRPARAVWARAKEDVWAVGLLGSVARYDGKTWKQVPGTVADGCLRGVTGNGPDDVWIYGEASFVAGSCFGLRVYHYDGRTMKDRTEEVSLAGVGSLNRIVAGGAGSAWMLGSLGTIRWDGTQFSRLPALIGVNDAWAASSKDVWFVSDRVHHWDGSQLEVVTSSSPAGGFSVISGTKSGDFWVGASNEGLLRSRRPLVSPR